MSNRSDPPNLVREAEGVSEARLKPRKVPRQLRAETTVASVIEAAARILEGQGLDAYNTNAIARLAGISVGSLYQYFPHKDAITRSLIERESSELMSVLERIAGKRQGVPAIREVVSAIVAHQMQRPTLGRILDMQEQSLNLADCVIKNENRIMALIEKILADAGIFAQSDRRIIVADMIGIIRGMVDGAVSRGEREAEQIIGRVGRAVEGYLTLSGRAPNLHDCSGR